MIGQSASARLWRQVGDAALPRPVSAKKGAILRARRGSQRTGHPRFTSSAKA